MSSHSKWTHFLLFCFFLENHSLYQVLSNVAFGGFCTSLKWSQTFLETSLYDLGQCGDHCCRSRREEEEEEEVQLEMNEMKQEINITLK